MHSLKDLIPSERPRERLMRDGPAVLTGAELIAIVLGTGRGSGEDALQLGARLHGELGGLHGLADASLDALLGVVGIGPVRAARLLAMFEIGERVRPAVDHELECQGELEPDSPLAVFARRVRGQVAISETALMAWAAIEGGETITLALGEALHDATRSGAILSQLLRRGPGPWWLAAIRQGGEPSKCETAAAARVARAANLVGVDLDHIVLVGTTDFWRLDGAEFEEDGL